MGLRENSMHANGNLNKIVHCITQNKTSQQKQPNTLACVEK